jgi:hypothetical protein
VDILAHAYALSNQHGGAPGVDGVTFEDIEGAGLEIGTRVMRAPKGLSASFTAFKTAPGAPATPPSPG